MAASGGENLVIRSPAVGPSARVGWPQSQLVLTMLGAQVSPAVEIAAEALVLRNSLPELPELPELPALEVLDQVMRSRYGRHVDFGGLAVPPSPFSLLVVDALDCMPSSDWAGPWRCGHPRVQPFLLRVWHTEVWPKFRVRYSLYG